MADTEKMYALTKWPSHANDMSVDLMLRILGREGQMAWLRKFAAMDGSKPTRKTPLYLAQTEMIISTVVGLMACIRKLRELDPIEADAFVKNYWAMCDAGDSFGELLWELAEAAGLDLEMVKLPPADDAVDPHVGNTGKPSTRD